MLAHEMDMRCTLSYQKSGVGQRVCVILLKSYLPAMSRFLMQHLLKKNAG